MRGEPASALVFSSALAARDKRESGGLSADEVWRVESEAVGDAVALQKAAGLKVCTDGEYHRRHWFLDFIERIDGVEIAGGMPARFHNEGGDVEFVPPKVEIRDKLRRSKKLALGEFETLKPFADGAGLTAKQCIPAPTILHFRGGRASVDKTAYPDMDQFFADLVLQPLHRQRDRGLGSVELLGRAREAALGDDHLEDLEGVEIHGKGTRPEGTS